MGWGGRKACQVPAVPLLELLPLCNAVIPFLIPVVTEHGNGKLGLDGRHWTVAERTASCPGQRSWAWSCHLCPGGGWTLERQEWI